MIFLVLILFARDRQFHSPAPEKVSVLRVSMRPLRVGCVEIQRWQAGRRRDLHACYHKVHLYWFCFPSPSLCLIAAFCLTGCLLSLSVSHSTGQWPVWIRNLTLCTWKPGQLMDVSACSQRWKIWLRVKNGVGMEICFIHFASPFTFSLIGKMWVMRSILFLILLFQCHVLYVNRKELGYQHGTVQPLCIYRGVQLSLRNHLQRRWQY